jgi:hypothetical protein
LCRQYFEFEGVPESDRVEVDSLGFVAYNAGLDCVQNIALLELANAQVPLAINKIHTFVFIDEESSLSRSAGKA